MWNAVSSLKQYRRSPLKSRSSDIGGGEQQPARQVAAASALCMLPLAFCILQSAVCILSAFSILHSQFSILIPGARPSPEHRRLFTPRHAPEGTYSAVVIDAPMETARPLVMRALGVPDAPTAGAGSWAVRRLEAGEAFGASAVYDETRLARLFNGRRAFVSRGPVLHDGEVVASVTLISPYPDPTLTRLEQGTLVIIFDVAAARSGATRLRSADHRLELRRASQPLAITLPTCSIIEVHP